METKTFKNHYHEDAAINTSSTTLFDYLNDHTRLSSHMSKSSWMMGGGQMTTSIDEGRGQRVGSHIRLSGKAFGVSIYLDEVVTRYEPPRFKSWETVGTPKLIIIGHYRMGVEITSGEYSTLRVFIDYNLPQTHTWLGYLFSKTYAKWCVRQMLYGAREYFNPH